MFYRKGRQDGKDVARFAGRVRKMGKVLHVLQEEYVRWEKCCMFCKKGTQDGKALHVLQEGYTRWEKCCMFYSGSEDGQKDSDFNKKTQFFGTFLAEQIKCIER
ncbi:hypothetical protein KQI67_22620 [Bacillus albus]|uniref:hypothetical protein n=1 Tax=Bacillus albus TaxID=2026189 RepID=UPI001C11F131|nr:hypothetical protein [Bacillus albus]MBU5219468.1 hypothetical protein [Bacillus albus]